MAIVLKQTLPKGLVPPEVLTIEKATKELMAAGYVEGFLHCILKRAENGSPTNILVSGAEFHFEARP